MFDSFKEVKQATSQTLEQKLSSNQKKIIGFNRCLLLLHMSKGDQCRELVNQLQEQFPNNDRLALISASLLLKEKKAVKAEELLKEFAEQHPDNSIRVQLSLAQLHLDKGNIQLAISTLQSISSLKTKPKMVATLVSLFEQVRDIAGAIRTLDEYASSASQTQKGDEEYLNILKESANFKLKHKFYKEAATTFEQVIKLRPADLEALAGVVIAYSHVDPKIAQKYEAKMPAIVGKVEVNAETLENLVAPRLGAKEEKREEKKEVQEKKKKKKKKKKKPFVPKDPNKPVDPERWIKLQLRSTYKKRGSRGKGKLEKGFQGVVTSDKTKSSLDRSKQPETPKTETSSTTSSTSSASDKQQQKPQQKPQQQQQKKKSRRRG